MLNRAQLTLHRHLNVRLRGDILKSNPFLRVYLVRSRAKTTGKPVNKFEDLYAVRSNAKIFLNLPTPVLH